MSDTDPSVSSLSDKDLYARCQEYGLNARVWRRRFAGLLPEVLQRELHRRRGYGSIYEFAFKLGGMSSASVDKVLHLAEKLEDKPILRAQLLSGEQGWSKIEKVAYVATPETDREWAEKVESMGTPALAAYVQVQREIGAFTEIQNQSGFPDVGELQPNFKIEQWSSLNFSVSPDVEKRLRLLKYQLEKEKGLTLSFNEVMHALMEGGTREAKMVIQVCPECAARKAEEVAQEDDILTQARRNIPAVVRRFVQAKYHGICAFPECTHAATSLHHTRRFALDSRHDPNAIVPLCKNHERLVHSGLIENETDPPEKWRLLARPDANAAKFKIDQSVLKFRKEATIPLHPL